MLIRFFVIDQIYQPWYCLITALIVMLYRQIKKYCPKACFNLFIFVRYVPQCLPVACVPTQAQWHSELGNPQEATSAASHWSAVWGGAWAGGHSLGVSMWQWQGPHSEVNQMTHFFHKCLQWMKLKCIPTAFMMNWREHGQTCQIN